VRRLVAIPAACTPGFLAALRRAFDDGDAVLPLDRRLGPPAAKRLLAELRPAVLVDPQDPGQPEHPLADPVPVEEGDALVMATSGSTGAPKGVVLSHDALLASALATSDRLGVDPTRDRWLACLTPAHVGGLGVITRAWCTATPLELAEHAGPEELAARAAGGATLVSLVATQLYRLGAERAGAFRRIVLGGSAAPDALPANVTTTYGLTETAGGVVYDGIPLNGVEVRIDPGGHDQGAGSGTAPGAPGAPGASGEILLRGPMLLRAYRSRLRHRDGDVVDPFDAHGFLATGDAGRIEPDGRLRVFGRIEECITTGGEKVWPAAVEAVLAGHPDLEAVAVCGIADAEWGERVVAYVVPHPDRPAPGLTELRSLVASTLANYAAPRQLVIVDALPRTALGKIRRAELSVLKGPTEIVAE
jgi:O-succinylbenzoic acid--CoA ligase